MTPIPAFYYRSAVPDDGAVLAEGEEFLVTRNNGVISIQCFAPWRPEFEEIYRRYNAEGVRITSTTIGWDGRSLDFLRHLPDLRSLLLCVDIPMDVTPLGDLEGLESLGLNWRAPGSPGEIDFQRLERLKECSISWNPAMTSVLKLESLRILKIYDAPRLQELDVTGLPRLAELDLLSCPALTRINLSERAVLLAIELANCSKLRPDWPRLSADLRYLCLRGRIGFAVEEIAVAKSLQFLWAELPSKRSSWEFLRDLPSLEGVRLIDLKITSQIAEIVRSINEANGNGSTLSAKPPRHLLRTEEEKGT